MHTIAVLFVSVLIMVLLVIVLLFSLILTVGVFEILLSEVRKEEKFFIPGWKRVYQLNTNFDSSRLFKR